jgi:hypothetical protein
VFLTNVIELCKLKNAKNVYSKKVGVEKAVESVEN